MEGNAIAAVPGDDGAGHDLTVYVSTQMPHGFADTLARILGLDRAKLRVVAPHVGGAFGGKAGLGAEHAAVVAAALRLQRPVSWVERPLGEPRRHAARARPDPVGGARL